MAARQREILEAASRLLRPGGRLVYATCSLLAEENDAIVDGFLAASGAFRELDASAELAAQGVRDLHTGTRLRLLPHLHGTDGFFAAVLERSAG
jgi:16S rRNA (cytosine967-C5)-methyltransferase